MSENPVATPREKIRLGASYWRLWSASVISNLGDGVAPRPVGDVDPGDRETGQEGLEHRLAAVHGEVAGAR